MTLIPYDAQTLFGVPIMVWLGLIGVAIYIWYAWKIRGPRDGD
jgi:hypothetical protein